MLDLFVLNLLVVYFVSICLSLTHAQNISSINGSYVVLPNSQNQFILNIIQEEQAEQSTTATTITVINSALDERLQILLQSAIDAKDCEWTADAIAEDRTFHYINSIIHGGKKEDLGVELLGQLMGTFSVLGFDWDEDISSTQQSIIDALDVQQAEDIVDEEEYITSIYWDIFTALKNAVDPAIQTACKHIFYSK